MMQINCRILSVLYCLLTNIISNNLLNKWLTSSCFLTSAIPQWHPHNSGLFFKVNKSVVSADLQTDQGTTEDSSPEISNLVRSNQHVHQDRSACSDTGFNRSPCYSFGVGYISISSYLTNESPFIRFFLIRRAGEQFSSKETAMLHRSREWLEHRLVLSPDFWLKQTLNRWISDQENFADSQSMNWKYEMLKLLSFFLLKLYFQSKYQFLPTMTL